MGSTIAGKRKLKFDAWGRGRYDLPAHTYTDGVEAPYMSVARAIARRSGVDVLTVSSDGYSLGRPRYRVTIGRIQQDGTGVPTAELLFSICEVTA